MAVWQPTDLDAAHAANLVEILKSAETAEIVLTPTGDDYVAVDAQGWVQMEHVQDLGDLLERTGDWSWRISAAGRERLREIGWTL
ncbi:hypothetical protein [Catenuloplanes japonicus]|uniref:hypothetical protein n=1 Tax=Catenuloplanes japonicus TaxID=33876 RepID=UPI000525A353|nr:hypothetical protein [Catenuloplanes japonicus]